MEYSGRGCHSGKNDNSLALSLSSSYILLFKSTIGSFTFEVVDESQAAVVHGGLQQRSETPQRTDAHHVKPGFFGVREGVAFG